jgi:hypothetical protein
MGGSIVEAPEVPETAFDWPKTYSFARSLKALKVSLSLDIMILVTAWNNRLLCLAMRISPHSTILSIDSANKRHNCSC